MKRIALLVLVLMLVSAACESESEREREKEEARGSSSACASPLPTVAPSLPSSFPRPADVTFTGNAQQGPTQVVTGFSTKELDEVYEAYKEQLGQGEYQVTKSEKEEDDAEVNFQSEDNTGQVALREECPGQTSVQIKIRPAS